MWWRRKDDGREIAVSPEARAAMDEALRGQRDGGRVAPLSKDERRQLLRHLPWRARLLARVRPKRLNVGFSEIRLPIYGSSLRIRAADLDRDGEAVLAVQRAGYEVEARLVGAKSLPGQHETIEDLRGEGVWVAEVDRRVAGVLGVEDREEVLIARLVVAPEFMRRGIGRALAQHALALAGDRAVRVGTAAANAPALALYASLGFERVGERTVGDGLAYVELVRRGARR